MVAFCMANRIMVVGSRPPALGHQGGKGMHMYNQAQQQLLTTQPLGPVWGAVTPAAAC